MTDKSVIESLREMYPDGCRVELVWMDDFRSPPYGTKGTVMDVSDTGVIHVKWDTGIILGAAYGDDVIRRIYEYGGK